MFERIYWHVNGTKSHSNMTLFCESIGPLFSCIEAIQHSVIVVNNQVNSNFFWNLNKCIKSLWNCMKMGQWLIYGQNIVSMAIFWFFFLKFSVFLALTGLFSLIFYTSILVSLRDRIIILICIQLSYNELAQIKTECVHFDILFTLHWLRLKFTYIIYRQWDYFLLFHWLN